MIVKLKLHPLHLIIAFFIPSVFYGMSEPKIAKQHSIKDYGELYSQQGLRSLQAICLGVIADNIKDTIDTKDPLNDKPLIEEILKQIAPLNLGHYGQYLLEYWKAHTQPTWKFLTTIPHDIQIEGYNSKLAIWFDSEFNKIGILQGNIISYKDNPFTKDSFDCLTSSQDNASIAISKKNQIIIFSGNHPYETIHGFVLPRIDTITSLIFSPDKNALVAGSSDSGIHYIFLQKATSYPTLTAKSSISSSIKRLTYAPNGTYFISIDEKGTALQWYSFLQTLQAPQARLLLLNEPVSKSIVSLDDKYIFFEIKDNDTRSNKERKDPQGFIVDVRSGEKTHIKDGIDIRGIAPGNNFFGIEHEAKKKITRVIRQGRIVENNEFEYIPWLKIIDVTGNCQKFLCHQNVPTMFSPTNPLDGITYESSQDQDSNEYSTRVYVIAEPTLDQLLFKLALEVALKHNKIVHTKSLFSHAVFSTFVPNEQQLLKKRVELALSKVNAKDIAQQFVDIHIKPLLRTNESFDIVLNPDMLDGYDNATLQKIHKHTKKAVRTWFYLRSYPDKPLDYFDLEGTKYLLSVNRHYVFDNFNNIVNFFKNDFHALKRIQSSGVEKKLRTFATDPKNILSVQDHIDTLITRKNEDLLHEGYYYGGETPDYYNLGIAKHMNDCITEVESSTPPALNSNKILPAALFGQAIEASEHIYANRHIKLAPPGKIKIMSHILHKHRQLQCAS